MKKKKIIRIVSIIIVCLLIMALIFFFSRNDSDNVTGTTETAETTTTAAAVTEIPNETYTDEEAAAIYSSVISSYYRAVKDKISLDSVDSSNLSYLVTYYRGESDLQKLGYLITDVDGNGIPELLIGNINGDEYLDYCVIALYTITDGEAEAVFLSDERDMYFSLTGGRFENNASSSAFLSSDVVYEFADDGKSLTLTEGVVYDEEKNSSKPWYKAVQSGSDIAAGDSLSESDADAAKEKYESMRTQLEYTKLSDYSA